MKAETIGRAWKRREVTLALACVAVAIVFARLSPYFLTAPNLATVLRNSVELLLSSLGISFVLATAGIDISIGGALGISAILIGRALQAGWPTVSLAVLGPLIGTGFGLLAGSIIIFGRIPPIVATLGLYGLYRSIMFLLLGGNWLSGLPDRLGPLVTTNFCGVPVAVVGVGFIYLLAWFILRWLPLGTAILATGGNEYAAHLAGVSTVRTELFVYGFTGCLVGLAALHYVARYRNVETSAGTALALDAIVAAVLGGTSVLGGRANLLGTLLGVLLVRLLQNGFILAGVPSLWEQVITGGLLILVLVLEKVNRRARLAGTD